MFQNYGAGFLLSLDWPWGTCTEPGPLRWGRDPGWVLQVRLAQDIDEQVLVRHDTRMRFEEMKEAVSPLCREFGVRRLDAFGSTARGMATSSSDVDLLVEFAEPDRNPATRFFGLLHRLEDLFGCHVDLLTTQGLRNPYFRARALSERVPVYED